MEDRIQRLENEIEIIRERNLRVEADKAWETSVFRVVFILVITYVFASIVLWLIGIEDYLSSALIPTLGYFLSTLSLPFVKRWWIRKNFNK